MRSWASGPPRRSPACSGPAGRRGGGLPLGALDARRPRARPRGVQEDLRRLPQAGRHGHEVGPNLAAMQNRGPEAILVNVLDPNREVNPQFVNYLLLTDDGRSLTGMITAETATSVTLKRAEAQSDTVLRVHIEELASTRLSIMPEGVEKQIDVQAMADLLAYLSGAHGAGESTGSPASDQSNNAAWKAGVAKVVITPQENMWMSGYGGRERPSEGKLTDLWAKALVLEDPRGQRAVLVTMDLVGIDRETSLAVRARSEGEAWPGAAADRPELLAHTLRAGGRQEPFADVLPRRAAAEAGLRLHGPAGGSVGGGRRRGDGQLSPSQIAWGRAGHVRRESPQQQGGGGAADSLQRRRAERPVDHDVPVLKVDGRRRLAAGRRVRLRLPCHGAELLSMVCGDYPGFAQIELEKAHPGATALFFAGCGADQNPLPRRTVELAQEYGRQLARAVDDVLGGKMTPIAGELSTTYEEIPLPLAKLPTKEELEEQDARTPIAFIASGQGCCWPGWPTSRSARRTRIRCRLAAGPGPAVGHARRRGGGRLFVAAEAGIGPQDSGSPATPTT